MEKITQTDKTRIEDNQERVGKKRQVLEVVSRRKRNWIEHYEAKKEKNTTEGYVKEKEKSGRRRMLVPDGMRGKRGYIWLKAEAQDRQRWWL